MLQEGRNEIAISKAFIYSCCCLRTAAAFGRLAAGITNYPPLVNPSHWTEQNKSGDTVILDAKGCRCLQRPRCALLPASMPDLANYPATMSGDALKTRIMDYSILDDDLYLHGNKVSENYKNILRKQSNISAIPQKRRRAIRSDGAPYSGARAAYGRGPVLLRGRQGF